MRLLSPSRQIRHQTISKRFITTRPATFSNIRYELLNRPPRTYSDTIFPAKSCLLLKAIPGLSLLNTACDIPLISSSSNHVVMPQGHHLVYFAPDHSTNDLLPDGTDTEHSPGPPFMRRLWASGSVTFNKGWKDHLLSSQIFDASCQEAISDVRLSGVSPTDQMTSDVVPGVGSRVFVEIERQYSSWCSKSNSQVTSIVERRTLCFMNPKTAEEMKRDLEQPSNKAIKGVCFINLTTSAGLVQIQEPKLTRTSQLQSSSHSTPNHSLSPLPHSSASLLSPSTPIESTSTPSIAARSKATATCSSTGPCYCC